MKMGTLTFEPVAMRMDLVAASLRVLLQVQDITADLFVAEIDPELADTAAFCDHYGISLDISANCIVVEARRAERTWYAACLVLATDMADVNNVVRKHLDARKISFAPIEKAMELTGMEYGGITPVGLPADWPILVDEAVMKQDTVIIGSGIRGSKLAVRTAAFRNLPNVEILNIAK
jgi:prolyl-tRNA editing enzyme YbaK/EbsC (Cys-tRNA(Pro) deacylase)